MKSYMINCLTILIQDFWHTSTLLSSKHKFSPKAIGTIFIGYPHGCKGYTLLDLTTHQTFISRDVKFMTIFFLSRLKAYRIMLMMSSTILSHPKLFILYNIIFSKYLSNMNHKPINKPSNSHFLKFKKRLTASSSIT